MFAYCNNNPVSNVDPTGHVLMQVSFDPDGASSMLTPGPWGGGGGGVAYALAGAAESMKVLNNIKDIITNSSETVVECDLKNNGFAFYNGVLVLSTDLLSGTSAFSFGIIVLGSGNIGTEDFGTTLNHEYGHRVHFGQLGPVDYFFTTAIPSLMGAALSSNNTWINENYYSLPWERVAENFGNVNRGYLPWADSAGSVFWICTLFISLATPW